MLSKILPVTVQSWQTGAHLLHFHTEYPILSSLSSYRRIAGRSRNSIECPRPLLLSPVALSAVLPYGALLFSPNPPPPPAATLVPRPMPLPQSASFSLAPNPARLCRPAPCPFFPFHPSVLLLCRPRQHTAGEDTSGIRSALTNRGAQHGLMLHHWTVPEVTWD